MQRRNSPRNEILTPDVFRNGMRWLREPVGDFGLWNGQFEQGHAGGMPEGWPEGWQIVEPANSIYEHTDADQFAGGYSMRSRNTGAGEGVTLRSLRYFPVSEDVDYQVSAAFKAANANCQCGLGALHYDASKAYLGTTIVTYTPGLTWVKRQARIGPNGDIAWTAGTRYARIRLALNTNTTYSTNWLYADDVQFQQLKQAYSPTIHLVDDTVDTTGTRTFTGAGWQQHGLSTMNLTLEEPGYIWICYEIQWQSDTARTPTSVYFVPYVDGVADGNPHTHGCDTAANWTITTLCRRSAAYARGAHTIELGIQVANAADTISVGRLSGWVFYTRQT